MKSQCAVPLWHPFSPKYLTFPSRRRRRRLLPLSLGLPHQELRQHISYGQVGIRPFEYNQFMARSGSHMLHVRHIFMIYIHLGDFWWGIWGWLGDPPRPVAAAPRRCRCAAALPGLHGAAPWGLRGAASPAARGASGGVRQLFTGGSDDFMVIFMFFYGFWWGFQWQLLVSGPGKKSGDFMGKFKH